MGHLLPETRMAKMSLALGHQTNQELEAARQKGTWPFGSNLVEAKIPKAKIPKTRAKTRSQTTRAKAHQGAKAKMPTEGERIRTQRRPDNTLTRAQYDNTLPQAPGGAGHRKRGRVPKAPRQSDASRSWLSTNANRR